MAESKIPVDLFNPGQVFACLGLVEIADVLMGDTEGGFDRSDFPATRFCLRTAGDKDPVESALRFLKDAKIKVLEPSNWTSESQKKWKNKWVVERERGQENVFPFPNPTKPATLPIELSADNIKICVDYWGDETRRDKAKFWSGMCGYPGAMLAHDAQQLILSHWKEVAVDEPFAFSTPQSNSFGFDCRRSYIQIDVGFTPKKQEKKISIIGYPVVELLAAIGMRYARPLRVKRLEYRYAVPMNKHKGRLFPPVFLRAALGAKKTFISGMLLRRFRMLLDKPGQGSKIRMITTVIEETKK